MGTTLLVLGQEISQVGRQRRVEAHPFTGRGMDELQVGGMEELAWRQWQLRPAIDAVANDGMANRGQVDTNLVRTPRL